MIDEDDDGDEEEQEEEGMWRKCGGHTLPTRVFMDENRLCWRQKWGNTTCEMVRYVIMFYL